MDKMHFKWTEYFETKEMHELKKKPKYTSTQEEEKQKSRNGDGKRKQCS